MPRFDGLLIHTLIYSIQHVQQLGTFYKTFYLVICHN